MRSVVSVVYQLQREKVNKSTSFLFREFVYHCIINIGLLSVVSERYSNPYLSLYESIAWIRKCCRKKTIGSLHPSNVAIMEGAIKIKRKWTANPLPQLSALVFAYAEQDSNKKKIPVLIVCVIQLSFFLDIFDVWATLAPPGWKMTSTCTRSDLVPTPWSRRLVAISKPWLDRRHIFWRRRCVVGRRLLRPFFIARLPNIDHHRMTTNSDRLHAEMWDPRAGSGFFSAFDVYHQGCRKFFPTHPSCHSCARFAKTRSSVNQN